MRLVHIQAIHAQLLKGDNIILAIFRLQLLELQFQLLAGTDELLDGKLVAASAGQFLNAGGDLVDLMASLSSFCASW